MEKEITGKDLLNSRNAMSEKYRLEYKRPYFFHYEHTHKKNEGTYGWETIISCAPVYILNRFCDAIETHQDLSAEEVRRYWSEYKKWLRDEEPRWLPSVKSIRDQWAGVSTSISKNKSIISVVEFWNQHSSKHSDDHLYLLRARDAIKIGRAKNVKSRLSQLSTGCPFPIEILAVAENKGCLERALHIRFIKNRIRKGGEWFNTSDEIIKLSEIINSVKN